MNVKMFLAMHGPLIRCASLTRPEQRTLQSALAAGYVTRLLPGVYAVEGSEDDVAVRAAAVVAWHPDAVVTGRAAARLTFWPRLRVTDVEVVRRGHPPRSRGYRFHERTVDPAHILELPSLRLTTPALTAVDLVDELGGDGIDTCLRARAARLEDLWTAFAAHPSRPGNNARRRMLLDSRDEPWSAAERLAHRLLRAAGIRGWKANYRVVVCGGRYFIDIAFPGIRLAVEIDGRLHEDDPSVFENDRYRQNQLVGAGWRVLRFTYPMLVSRPDYVVATIRAEIARRQGGAGR
jgi:very-short-patch-repair endonuclease